MESGNGPVRQIMVCPIDADLPPKYDDKTFKDYRTEWLLQWPKNTKSVKFTIVMPISPVMVPVPPVVKAGSRNRQTSCANDDKESQVAPRNARSANDDKQSQVAPCNATYTTFSS